MTAAPVTLEAMLTHPAGFDLHTASPLQRAIARAADGLPIGDVLDDDAVRAHFGCSRDALGQSKPALVVLVCGVRGGKSLLAGCAAVKGSLTADLSALKPHELPRFPIVAPTVDNATATFRLLTGSVQASPALRALVVGEPTADTMTLRRPDGRLVEIVVVAAHRGAVTLRSRWQTGFTLEEVATFGVESTGAAINAEELLRVGETRMVKGAQGWLISSPYGPQGLLWEMSKEHFGKPGRVLVVRAPTLAMNPTFPVEQIEAVRARAPDVAAREYDAAWLDPDTAFFSGADIDRATRDSPLERPPVAGAEYLATMDAATRGNSWTLTVGRKTKEGVEVSLARQWTGSRIAPLDPLQVFREIATAVAPYGRLEIHCDAWAIDPLRSTASASRLSLRAHTLTAENKVEIYRAVETLLRTGGLELPPHDVLTSDLRAVRKRALAGGLRVDLPRTPDGRHADFAPSVALLVWLIGPTHGEPGILAYYREMYGGPPAVKRPTSTLSPPESEGLIPIAAPTRLTGTVMSKRGTIYQVLDGQLLVRPCDVEEIERLCKTIELRP